MNFSKKLIALIITIVILVCSFAFAASSTGAPRFVLNKVKVKVGETQKLGSILAGADIDLDRLNSSNPSVIRILENGNLKAVATGISTITYTYGTEEEEKEIYCFVEVTRDEQTYSEVTGVKQMEIKLSLIIDGVTTIIKSNNGAIPTFPEFKKDGMYFDGWYKDPAFTEKVGERERFGKDTNFYARWLTEAEYEAMNTKVFQSSFYDDTNDHWGRVAIEATTNLGLFNGVSERTFGPEIAMTRAMAVAVIGRLEGANVEGLKSGLKDVKEDSYYDGYLAWAIENKIVTDVKDGNFRPNDEITREEIANYIANLIDYRKFEINTILDIDFSDVKELSVESRQAIKVL